MRASARAPLYDATPLILRITPPRHADASADCISADAAAITLILRHFLHACHAAFAADADTPFHAAD
jgi:hypothetical protein